MADDPVTRASPGGEVASYLRLSCGDPCADLPPVQEWTTQQLRGELARGLTLTAEVLTRLGAIWQELERRGEDLSDLRRGLARYLPLVAAGQLAAEAVVAFAGRAAVLRALVGVPLGRQRALAAGEPVRVIDPDRPGTVTEMPLATLPAASLGVVFADGEVRDPAAQRLALRTRRQRTRPAEGSGYRYRPRYDRQTGVVTVGRLTFALADLLTELAGAAGPDHPPADVPDEYKVVRVRLTDDEFRSYQALCHQHALPDWEMARKALRAFGLI